MEFFGLEGSWKVMSFQPLPPPIQPGLEHFQCIDQAKIKVTHLGNPSFYVPVRPEGGGILGRGHPAGHYLSSLSMAPWILPNSQEFFPWLRQESRWPILHPPEVFNWNKTKGKQIPERTIMSCLHGLDLTPASHRLLNLSHTVSSSILSQVEHIEPIRESQNWEENKFSRKKLALHSL